MADLTGKTIAELPEDSSISGSELIPVMDGATSKRLLMSTLQSQFCMAAVGERIDAGANIDEMLTPGTYYVAVPANITGGTPPPTGGYSYKLTITQAFTGTGSTKRIWQIAQVMNAACTECRRNYNGSEWGDWVTLNIGAVNTQIATLAAALGSASLSSFTIATNSQVNIEIANSQRGILFVASSSGAASGVYAVTCTSTGAVTANALVDGTALTLTAGTNALTITSTSSYTAYGLLVNF